MQLQHEAKMKSYNAALMGMFLACILILGLVERMIPVDFIVPGFKLGLSNVAIMVAIYCFNFSKVLMLVMAKCFLLAFVSGSISSLIYSLCGSILSFLIMWLMIKIFKEKISPIGVSVIGAIFHSVGQIAAACFVLGSIYIVTYLPVLLLLSTITGVFVGFVVKATLSYIKPHLEKGNNSIYIKSTGNF